MEAISTKTDEFSNLLRSFLYKILAHKDCPAVIQTKKNKIKLIFSFMPEIVIDFLGPVLYTYREEIYKQNEKFFMNFDLVQKHLPPLDIISPEQISEIFTAICTKFYPILTSEEITEYWSQINQLLLIYIDYQIAYATYKNGK
uniref:Uncharacterized protein n=1 Tax=Abalone asfa-like virus TaxID=2839893 RepID=A0A5K7XYP4_9VIRU|nr:hypothetical protein [Abalone asfa-like virus]BCY04622.1 hypothetical protein [Abalone asfa-like virus]